MPRQVPDSRADISGALVGLAKLVVRRPSREVSLTAVATLSTLDLTGSRRVTDLANIEGVAQPSMTVIVSNLEELGLVERREDPTDGRVTMVVLTTKGVGYIRNRRQVAADEIGQLLAKLTIREIATLAAAVPAMRRLRELEEQQRDVVRSGDANVGAES